jgi:hypothetical protein
VQPTPLADWTGAELVARGVYVDPDIVFDSEGFIHIAAGGGEADNKGIWYFTNEGGYWTSQQVASPPPAEDGEQGDGEPSIALDTDGSVWIAFSRWTCWQCYPDSPDGTWYVTDASGTWSEPQQIAQDANLSPSLVVRDGIVHVAYNERTNLGHGEDYPVWYSTNASGEWVTTQVVRKGASPQLAVDASGTVQILFLGPNDIRLATKRPSGDFSAPEPLSGSTGESSFEMAVDTSDGRMWVGWDEHTADSYNVMVAEHGPNGWSQPLLALTEGHISGLAANGLVNVIASAAGPDARDELIYAWNAHADHSFFQQHLEPSGGSGAAVAVGPYDRATVVYAIESPMEERGLWMRTHMLPAKA